MSPRNQKDMAPDQEPLSASEISAAESDWQPQAPDPEPVALVEVPKPKAKRAGHTVCRITGTDVSYHGKYVKEGTVGEFEDAIVLDMPHVFVSLE
jgi:hypothetical protein